MEKAKRESSWVAAWRSGGHTAAKAAARGIGVSLFGAAMAFALIDEVPVWTRVAIACVAAISIGLVMYAVEAFISLIRQRNRAWDTIDEVAGNPASMAISRLRECVVVEDRGYTAADLFIEFWDDLGGGMIASRMVTELHRRLDPDSEFEPHVACEQAVKIMLAEGIVDEGHRDTLGGPNAQNRVIRATDLGREVRGRLKLRRADPDT